MKDFRDLHVWEKAHRCALDVYRLTAGFPRSERYGLVAQMRRAAVSVASNIAEGCGRHSDRDFARFLSMAFGSMSELEYQLLLAHDLNFVDLEAHGHLVESIGEVKRMLAGLIRRLTANS